MTPRPTHRARLAAAVVAALVAAAVVPITNHAAIAATPEPLVRNAAPPQGFTSSMRPLGPVRYVEVSTLPWLRAAESAGRTGELFAVDLPDGTVTHARLRALGAVDAATVRVGSGPGPETVTWTGELAGADRRAGELYIAATRPPDGQWADAVLSATIWTFTLTSSAAYSMEWTGPGQYALYQVDPTTPSLGDSAPSSSTPASNIRPAGVAGIAAPASPGPGGTTDGGTIPAVITVAVINTVNAGNEAVPRGGITALVDEFLGHATAASAQSGVPIIYQRVGAVTLTGDAESGNTVTDLGFLLNPTDGMFDEGTALRNSQNADLGLLVGTGYSDNCGLAAVSNNDSAAAFRASAFSVVSLDPPGAAVCLDTTLAHEVGHNTGGRHDWNHPGNLPASAWPDNHGFQNPGAGIRTLMAEEDPGCVGCLRVDRWSNPLTPLPGGAATGVDGGPTPANNARVFNMTAETIAAMMPVRTDWYGPGATRLSSTQVRLFARGATDQLYQRIVPGGSWSLPVGGIAKSDPDVTSAGTNRVNAFAQGADGAIWHIYSTNNGSTYNLQSLSGNATSGPAAVSWGTNSSRLDVFARGGDGALWQNTSTNAGTSWSGWQNRGGNLTSDPDVSSWGVGRLDVYARGGDGALYHMAFASGAWQPWESLGGLLTSAPAAVSWGVNRADVIARGTDGAAWAINWTPAPAGWSGFTSIGGNLISAPDIASTASNRLQIFARGTSGALFEQDWNGTGLTGWYSLG